MKKLFFGIIWHYTIRKFMEIKKYSEGLFEFVPKVHSDLRGKFIKTFSYDFLKNLNLSFDLAEEFYSISNKNVLRGLHFQIPPFDHIKIVYCISGMVLDVVVDLRHKSKTFGKVFSFELTSEKSNVLYIDRGFAHGFYSLDNNSVMLYKTSTVYSPCHDSGILWNSINFKWPSKSPILSDRDKRFETFEEFLKKRIF